MDEPSIRIDTCQNTIFTNREEDYTKDKEVKVILDS